MFGKWSGVVLYAALSILGGGMCALSLWENYELQSYGKETKAVIIEDHGQNRHRSTDGKTTTIYYEYRVQYEEGTVRVELGTPHKLGDQVDIVYVPGTGRVVVKTDSDWVKPLIMGAVCVMFAILLGFDIQKVRRESANKGG